MTADLVQLARDRLGPDPSLARIRQVLHARPAGVSARVWWDVLDEVTRRDRPEGAP
jgi:hypothetical protein